MAAASAPPATRVAVESSGTTLLALVRAIGEVTDDEREIVATVLHLLQTGQVHLTGNFRNAPIRDLE